MAKDTDGGAPDRIIAVLPNLPRDIIGIQSPRRGEWTEAGLFKQLDALGTSFFDDRERLGPEAFLSLPDVWAQTEAYRMALGSERRVAYSMFVGEWRGLLALVGLQKAYGFQITPEEYDFSASDSPMAKVLSAHPPRSRITGEGPWTKVAILRLRPIGARSAGVVVGLAVPSVIAVPAKSYRIQLKEQLDDWNVLVPWLVPAEDVGLVVQDRRHYLADPCEPRFVERIGISRYRMLGAYLKGLSDNLRGVDGPLAGAIKSRLDSFIADIQRVTGRMAAPLLPTQTHRLSPSVSLPDTFTIYDESNPYNSDFSIPVREGFGDRFSGGVLIDVGLARRLGAEARNWLVWGNTTAADLVADPTAAKRVAAQIAADCEARPELRERPYLVVNGDDLFAGCAVQFHNDTLIDENQAFRNFAYPLTPLALMLYDQRQLQQAAQIEQTGDKITARLAFNCRKIDGSDAPVEIRRDYPRAKSGAAKSGEAIDRELPSAFSLWPNVRIEGWTWNFGLFAGNIDRTVAVDGYAGFETIKAASSAANGARASNLVGALAQALRTPRNAVRSGGKGGWQKVELHTPQEFNSGERNELHQIFDYPEAILLKARLDGGASADCGMVFTHPRRLYTSAAVTKGAVVGIDFGTTNTTAYAAVEDGDPVLVKLARRYWSPRGEEWSSEERRIGALAVHNELFPWAGRELPFQTALRERRGPQFAGPVATAPILAATIFLEPDADRYLREIGKQTSAGDQPPFELIFDLKWSSTNWDRRLSLYLAQLVLQTVVELVALDVNPAKIEWRFSYPEAFDLHKTKRFKEQCRDLVAQVYEGLADDLRPRAQDSTVAAPKVTFDKESVSAARFFVGRPGTNQNAGHVVTVDIGGGTSDISIWHRRALIWRASIPLAGKAILIDYVVKRPSMLYNLLRAKGASTTIEGLDRVNSNNSSKFGNAAESIINSVPLGDDLFTPRRLLARDGGSVLADSGPAVIRRSKLALAAILYYIGGAYRTLQQQKDAAGNPLIPINAKDNLEIHIGGRASKLFRNLFDDEEDIAEFVSVFRAASQQAFGSAQLSFSERPKHEVAFGLVVGGDEWGRRYAATDRAKSVAVPAGESLLVGDGPDNSADVWADMRSLDPHKAWRLSEMKGLQDFLKLCRRTLQIDVKFGPGAEAGIGDSIGENLDANRDGVLSALAEQANDDVGAPGVTAEDSVALEAPFIRAIREILRFNANDGDAKVAIVPYGGGQS